jgi:hypothetical protein
MAGPRAAPVAECRLCAGPHDPAIHEAVLRVHRWLRERVLLLLGFQYEAAKRKPKPGWTNR